MCNVYIYLGVYYVYLYIFLLFTVYVLQEL